MSEIKIEKIAIKEFNVEIPDSLKDSKVGMKFVEAYFEKMEQVELEKEKTEQLKEQNKRKNEEDEYKSLYLLAIVAIVAMLIISIDKDRLEQIISAIVLFVICVILYNKRKKNC